MSEIIANGTLVYMDNGGRGFNDTCWGFVVLYSEQFDTYDVEEVYYEAEGTYVGALHCSVNRDRLHVIEKPANPKPALEDGYYLRKGFPHVYCRSVALNEVCWTRYAGGSVLPRWLKESDLSDAAFQDTGYMYLGNKLTTQDWN